MRRIVRHIADVNVRHELQEIWKRLGYTETKTSEPTVSTLAPGEMACYSGVLYFNDAGTIRKVTVDTNNTAYLKADGSVDLTGNLSVDSGVTIDGVDIGAHAANASAHHSKYTDAEAIIAALTIKLDDFASPEDNTDLDASITTHGLLIKGDNDTTHFLRGDITWAVPASTPGGSDTQVQFNNSGAFGGDANFVWDNTNKQLIVGGETSGLGHFNVVDYDIDISARHIGSYVYVSKTDGTTDENDWLYGGYVSAYISDSGETHGLCVGQYVISHLADGSIGTSGTNKNMTGQRVDSNVATNGTVYGNVYGLHVAVDHDGTISGDAIGVYITDTNDNLDYAIYADGDLYAKGVSFDSINIVCHNDNVVCNNDEVVFS